MYNIIFKKFINSKFAFIFFSFLASILINPIFVELTFSQTAEEYFQQGKSDLEHQLLESAHTNFQSALNLDPDHQGANLFYAMTRILMISKSSAFNTLLDRAGISSTGRDIFNWTADFQKDPEGRIILPPDTPTGEELQTFIKNNILPEVNSALENLSKVTNSYETNYKWIFENGSGSISSQNIIIDPTKNWEFNELVGNKIVVNGSETEYTIIWNDAHTIQVTPNWSVSPGTYGYEIYEKFEIDYGDVLVTRGLLYSTKMAINIISSYNLNVDIDTIFSLFNQRILSFQDHIINTYQDFLKLLPSHQLAQAKSDLSEAINTFKSAINFILSEVDPQEDDLFLIEDLKEETFWRELFDDLNNSLSGTTYIRALEEYVNLSQFFDSPKNLRNYLPTFRGLYIERDTYPDPTFGEILPYMTADVLNQELEKGCILVGPLPGLVAYDDFSGDNINKIKWRQWEYGREIRDGKLFSKITAYGTRVRNRLEFSNPAPINYIEANVVIEHIEGNLGSTGVSNYASPRAQLTGFFYNDGTASGSGSYMGEVQGSIHIAPYNNQLWVYWFVWKSTSEDASIGTILGWGYFPLPVSLNTTYKLSIQFEPSSKMFTFGVEGQTPITWTSTDTIYPSNRPWKAIGTDIPFFGTDISGLYGKISATFDNVVAKDESGNVIISDDFSSSVIDNTKWGSYEFVREISDGKLRSKTRSSLASSSYIYNRMEFLNSSLINFIEARVTPKTYENLNSRDIVARLAGYFFNDGTPGGGRIGDVGAQVRIGGSGINPVASWLVWKERDLLGGNPELLASGTFNKPILLNNTYTLFLGWDGRTFIFKIDDEVSYYHASGQIPPKNPWKEIGTRILNPTGNEATIEALFDDVMVAGPWTPKLLDPSGTTTTSTPMYMWEAVSGATSYRLYVNDSLGPNPKIDQSFTPSQANCPSGFGECWVIPSTNLAQGEATWWVQASNSVSTSPWSIGMNFNVVLPCKGDFDLDGDVDKADLAIFASEYGRRDCSSFAPCRGDLDWDSDVDGKDLAIFASEYGRTNCPH